MDYVDFKEMGDICFVIPLKNAAETELKVPSTKV